MIIECERCHTKFNLDENLLKETGSKVRCSICKHIFTAFPPKPEIEIEKDSTERLEEQEIVPPEEAPKEEGVVPDVDKTIVTEAVEGLRQEEEGIEAISFEDISQLDSGLIKEEEEEVKIDVDVAEAMERAARIEEEILAREEEEKGEKIEETEKPAKTRPIIKKRRRSKLWITILLIVLLLVGAAAALIVFKPDFLPESLPLFKKHLSKEQVFDMGNKRLSFKDLNGSFVNLKKAGKLFLVKGLVVNNYPDKRNYIRIKSNILDSKSKVVKSKIAFAGNPINDKELQSLSIEEINKRLMNKFGKNKINTNILPGSSIPFMIIFSDLPEDISEFTVEAISSFPAKK